MATNIFRQQALDKMASPEQLDMLMQVTDPKGWLALLGFGIIILLGILWAVFGTLQTTASSFGMIVPQNGMTGVTAPVSGTVSAVLVPSDQLVRMGQPIMRVRSKAGVQVVTSPQNGRLLNVSAYPGAYVSDGTPLASVEPPQSRLDAVFYLPAAEVHAVQPGMQVHIEPVSANQESTGYVLGTVQRVSTYPATPESARAIFQNPDITKELLGPGTVYQVTVGLSRNASGYAWSSGHRGALQAGTFASASFVIKAQHPMGLLF